MKPFLAKATYYTSYHHKPIAKYLHGIGTFFLSFAVLVLLGFVKVSIPGVLATSFATLAVLALLVYYFRLNWRLAAVATPILLVLMFLAHLFSQNGPSRLALWAFILTLVVGVVLQWVGYLLEDKRPSVKELGCLLPITPIMVTAELLFVMGQMPALKKSVYGKGG